MADNALQARLPTGMEAIWPTGTEVLPWLVGIVGCWGDWPGGKDLGRCCKMRQWGAFGAKIGQNRIKSDKIGQNRMGFLASDSVQPYKDQWVTGRKSSQNRMNQLVASLLEKKNII